MHELHGSHGAELGGPQLNLIHDMIVSKSFTARQIAEAAGCSIPGVKRLRSDIRFFGTVKAPWNGGGRPRPITSMPSANTSWENRTDILMKWYCSCGMSLKYPYPPLQSAER